MAATERLVLDGSVTLAWFFKDEADPYADAIAGLFPNVEAWVAGIWPLEVANSLLVGERRKRSTQAEAQKWLISLRSLGINVDGETTVRAFNEILNLGRSQNLSAYDAAYLELALRKGLPLASLDDKLKAAAASVGVQLYTVP